MTSRGVFWMILLGLFALGIVISHWQVAVAILAVASVAAVLTREHLRRARAEGERRAREAQLERQARRFAMLEDRHKSEDEDEATPETPAAPRPPTAGERQRRSVSLVPRAFEFDVALSFAGEDRIYVHDIAERLREQGVRVFYDEFLASELWGEDLFVYFDDVFGRKARYVVVFVSKHYVSKPWTSHERRSAQARFLHESAPSFLPVRLDDSELPGLHPTVGYVDARTVSPQGLVGLILQKLGNEPAERETVPRVDRVPRTTDEEALLLASRPPGWEYLLFAAILLRQRNALDPELRDHVLGLLRPWGPSLDDEGARSLLSTAFRQARAIAGNVERVLTPEAQELAFGRPGMPGDPRHIEHLAQRLVDTYADFLEWAARLRGAGVPDRFERALEIASSFADQPIQQMRDFIDRTVAEIDRLPALLRKANDNTIIELSLTLTMEDDLLAELDRELALLRE